MHLIFLLPLIFTVELDKINGKKSKICSKQTQNISENEFNSLKCLHEAKQKDVKDADTKNGRLEMIAPDSNIKFLHSSYSLIHENQGFGGYCFD